MFLKNHESLRLRISDISSILFRKSGQLFRNATIFDRMPMYSRFLPKSFLFPSRFCKGILIGRLQIPSSVQIPNLAKSIKQVFKAFRSLTYSNSGASAYVKPFEILCRLSGTYFYRQERCLNTRTEKRVTKVLHSTTQKPLDCFQNPEVRFFIKIGLGKAYFTMPMGSSLKMRSSMSLRSSAIAGLNSI